MLPVLLSVFALLFSADARSLLLNKPINQPITDVAIHQSIDQSVSSACPVGVPYDLSQMPQTVFASNAYPSASYRLSPCRSINQCPYPNQSLCFQYNGQYLGLGSTDDTTWSLVDGDYINGAESNVDTIYTPNQQRFCSSPSSADVTVIYKCNTGDDSILIITEPESASDDCTWIFEVDSSIVCAAQEANDSSSSSISINQSIIWGSVGCVFIAVMMVFVACYVHRRKQARRADPLSNSLLGNQGSVPAQHVLSLPQPTNYNAWAPTNQPINNQQFYTPNPSTVYQQPQPAYVQPMMYQPNPQANMPVYHQ